MIEIVRLQELLDQFPKLTIGLLGDLFLDRYLEFDPAVSEMSIETGLEAFQVERVRNSPGALGTVMNNLAAIGVGQLVPITVIGDDGHGDDLMRELRRLPCSANYVLRDVGRLTPTYIKPLRLGSDGVGAEMNRVDVRTRGPLSAAVCQQLGDSLRAAFDQCDGLIVLDQVNETDWGVVNGQVRNVLADVMAASPNKLVFVDSRAHLDHFTDGILKANQDELLAIATGIGDPTKSVRQTAKQLAMRTGQPVFCTLGAEGMLVARPAEEPMMISGFTVTGPVDIVGAGDSATSAIVMALLSGSTEDEAAEFGNLVASITVQQLGTTGTASPEQILSRRKEFPC
ncbi:MAG: PfkB family carbohydrate kinase [Pirellulaceae bacterium]|jgi:bifunctional ADP-heptose synthase (sugar kinase/adenylyltransferase)|nr:PfkB family carbohydrate kinase [Pirellulaceae bacterium]